MRISNQDFFGLRVRQYERQGSRVVRERVAPPRVVVPRESSGPDHWWESAACKGRDLDFTDPGKGSHAAIARRVVCRLCPVADECSREGEGFDDDWTFRAGLTGYERRVSRD